MSPKKPVQIMSEPAADEHIAACGLFCSNCRAFKRGKCKGCQVAPGYASCAVRGCCIAHGITRCGELSHLAICLFCKLVVVLLCQRRN